MVEIIGSRVAHSSAVGYQDSYHDGSIIVKEGIYVHQDVSHMCDILVTLISGHVHLVKFN